MEICGVGISSTVSTLLLLGKDMEVLRPALMWCDVRATKQAERIAANSNPGGDLLWDCPHFECLKKYVDLQEICLSGGLTRSNLYLRILADVTGLTLHIPRETEASCFGAAILGAVAGGAYGDIHTASQSMVQYQSTISPDAENHRRYQFYLKNMKRPMCS